METRPTGVVEQDSCASFVRIYVFLDWHKRPIPQFLEVQFLTAPAPNTYHILLENLPLSLNSQYVLRCLLHKGVVNSVSTEIQETSSNGMTKVLF